MTQHRDESIDAASQYLIWALEELEKIGDQNAAEHVRLAMQALNKNVEYAEKSPALFEE